jgi:hypothetical protein
MSENALVILFIGPALLTLLAGIVYSLNKWKQQPQAAGDWKPSYWGCLPAFIILIGIIAYAYFFASTRDDSFGLFIMSPFAAFLAYFTWNVGTIFGEMASNKARSLLTLVHDRGGWVATLVVGVIVALGLLVIAVVLAVLSDVLTDMLNDWLGFPGPTGLFPL